MQAKRQPVLVRAKYGVGFELNGGDSPERAFNPKNGLQKTEGVLDSVSLSMLGLAPMGSEIFLPIVGPQCAINQTTKPVSMCEIPAENKRGLGSHFRPFFQDSAQSLLATIIEMGCEGLPPDYVESRLSCATRR